MKLCCLWLGLSLLCLAQDSVGNQPFSLKVTQGRTVRVDQPVELVQSWQQWQKNKRPTNKWGTGFFIDWGDKHGEGDSFDGPGNSLEIGRHTYARAGTYTVTAGFYKFLPSDGHEWLFRRKTTVTVP